MKNEIEKLINEAKATYPTANEANIRKYLNNCFDGFLVVQKPFFVGEYFGKFISNKVDYADAQAARFILGNLTWID